MKVRQRFQLVQVNGIAQFVALYSTKIQKWQNVFKASPYNLSYREHNINAYVYYSIILYCYMGG